MKRQEKGRAFELASLKSRGGDGTQFGGHASRMARDEHGGQGRLSKDSKDACNAVQDRCGTGMELGKKRKRESQKTRWGIERYLNETKHEKRGAKQKRKEKKRPETREHRGN